MTTKIEKIGNVTIADNNGSLLIRFTYQKKLYQIGRGKYSETNLIATRQLATQIYNDIIFNHFDVSLNRYRPTNTSDKDNLTDNNKSKKQDNSIDNLKELWLSFKTYQSKFLKPSSMRSYSDIEKLLNRVNFEDNPKLLESKLLEVTTIEQTRRALSKVSQCYAYHDVNNPKIVELKTLLKKYTPSYAQNLTKPYCLSDNEIELIRASDLFSLNEKLLIEIWLNTGVRPSSALAITTKDIDLNKRVLTINGSVQRNSDNQLFLSKGSKNNKYYSIPINETLVNSLDNYFKRVIPNNYLFWDKENNNYLSLQTLRQRGLLKRLRKITGNPKLTFYNFRDTFISRNILNNIPIAVIANWCDTSVSEIEKKYFDVTKISYIPT